MSRILLNLTRCRLTGNRESTLGGIQDVKHTMATNLLTARYKGAVKQVMEPVYVLA